MSTAQIDRGNIGEQYSLPGVVGPMDPQQLLSQVQSALDAVNPMNVQQAIDLVDTAKSIVTPLSQADLALNSVRFSLALHSRADVLSDQDAGSVKEAVKGAYASAWQSATMTQAVKDALVASLGPLGMVASAASTIRSAVEGLDTGLSIGVGLLLSVAITWGATLIARPV